MDKPMDDERLHAFLGSPFGVAIDSSYMRELLQLFHTYGNRERLDELKKVEVKGNGEIGDSRNFDFTSFYYIQDRIKELNREVES